MTVHVQLPDGSTHQHLHASGFERDGDALSVRFRPQLIQAAPIFEPVWTIPDDTPWTPPEPVEVAYYQPGTWQTVWIECKSGTTAAGKIAAEPMWSPAAGFEPISQTDLAPFIEAANAAIRKLADVYERPSQ